MVVREKWIMTAVKWCWLRMGRTMRQAVADVLVKARAARYALAKSRRTNAEGKVVREGRWKVLRELDVSKGDSRSGKAKVPAEGEW